jgi:hypothetical protein
MQYMSDAALCWNLYQQLSRYSRSALPQVAERFWKGELDAILFATITPARGRAREDCEVVSNALLCSHALHFVGPDFVLLSAPRRLLGVAGALCLKTVYACVW